MDAITEALNQAGADILNHLSTTVFIRGVEFSAIFRDEPYEDEVGYRRLLTLSVSKDDARQLRKDDIVSIGHDTYKINHIPETTDYIVDMELKNA